MENPSNKPAGNEPQGYFKRYPVGRVVLACVLGVLAGAFQPFVLMMSMTVCIMPIILCALYAWAGWIPAVLSAVSALFMTASGASMLGIDPTLLTAGGLVLMIVPAAAVIYAMEKKMKFFHRLTIGIAVQTAALLLCITVIYTGLKIDLIDLLTGMLREGMNMLPAGSVTLMLEQFASYGLLTEESIAELSGGILTAGDIAKVLDQVFEALNYALKQVMLAAVLSSGLISGIAMTSISSRISRDCGMQPPAEHIMIDYWRVPPSIVGMTVVGMAAGFGMQFSGVGGSEAVTAVFSVLASELLIVQGIAAISRRFREVNASALSRLGLIAASLLLMPGFLEIAGIFSLLMGSEGIITKWMKKRIEERESEDDDE